MNVHILVYQQLFKIKFHQNDMKCLYKFWILATNAQLSHYLQINTWAFPYWPGYHPETLILIRDGVEGQYGSSDDNQANMEMPMY